MEILSVEIDHAKYLANPDRYRERLHLLLVRDPYDPTCTHDGECCKREPWPVTQATITAVIDEDPASWWTTLPHLLPPGARWLWSNAYGSPKQPTTPTGESK